MVNRNKRASVTIQQQLEKRDMWKHTEHTTLAADFTLHISLQVN